MPPRRRTPKLLRYLAGEQLVGVLNHTKWERLFEALLSENLPVDFRRKDVYESESLCERWDGDIFHIFGGCEVIEWLDIRTKIPVSRGWLLKPEIQDFTPEVVAAAKRAKIPYSLTPEGIRVWGYIRPSSNVQWENERPGTSVTN